MNFYSLWQPVRINAGSGGSKLANGAAFFINGTGLQYTTAPNGTEEENEFRGWIGELTLLCLHGTGLMVQPLQCAIGGMADRSYSGGMMPRVRCRGPVRMSSWCRYIFEVLLARSTRRTREIVFSGWRKGRAIVGIVDQCRGIGELEPPVL